MVSDGGKKDAHQRLRKCFSVGRLGWRGLACGAV